MHNLISEITIRGWMVRRIAELSVYVITYFSLSFLRGEGNYDVFWLNNFKIMMVMILFYSTILGYLPLSLIAHFVGRRLANKAIVIEALTFVVHSYLVLCILYNQVIGLSNLVDYSASRFLAWIAVLFWVVIFVLWSFLRERGSTAR